MGPSPSPKRGHSPHFLAHVYCGQTAAWIKMPLGTEVGLGPYDIVLNGDPAPLPKKGAEPLPNFQLMSIVAKQLDAQGGTWHGGGPWSRPYCARWGPSSPPQKGDSPQFSAHFYYGPTAGCIKMPLGMEVGLSPGEFVFDGDPATPRKKGHTHPPNFWPMSIVAKRLDGCRRHFVRK